jgi:hypothetical protein
LLAATNGGELLPWTLPTFLSFACVGDVAPLYQLEEPE